jgi:hypothetical protein
MPASMLHPRYDPLAGTRPVQPDWSTLSALSMRTPVVLINPPDIAAANAQANAQAAQTAAATAAAAGGIQNQKDDDLVSAMLALQGQSPKQAALERQVKLADAIRNRGASLNTGSVNGAAPNWAGALADVVGAYKSGQMDKASQAGADALAGETRSAAQRYFDALRGASRGA